MFFLRYYQEKEPIRSLMVLDPTSDLPPDQYVFVENFCGDKTCDCRKVMINAVSESQKKILGTFSYGWEDLAYYLEWLYGDKELAKDLKGPSLETTGIQSKYAKMLLEHFKEFTKDVSYMERLKRHYLDFKKRLKEMKRNDPCLCGSTKKWKACCMEFAISL